MDRDRDRDRPRDFDRYREDRFRDRDKDRGRDWDKRDRDRDYGRGSSYGGSSGNDRDDRSRHWMERSVSGPPSFNGSRDTNAHPRPPPSSSSSSLSGSNNQSTNNSHNDNNKDKGNLYTLSRSKSSDNYEMLNNELDSLLSNIKTNKTSSGGSGSTSNAAKKLLPSSPIPSRTPEVSLQRKTFLHVFYSFIY